MAQDEHDKFRNKILDRLGEAYSESISAWRRYNRLYTAANSGGIIATLSVIGTQLGSSDEFDRHLLWILGLFLLGLVGALVSVGGEIRRANRVTGALASLTGSDLNDLAKRREIERLVHVGAEIHWMEKWGGHLSTAFFMGGLVNSGLFLFEHSA